MRSETMMDDPLILSLKTAAALSLVAVIFVSLNISAGILLPNAKMDLTERELHTLSEGAKNLIHQMERPVTLRLFFSKRQAAQYPALLAQGERTARMLRQMASLSNGKIKLQILDPEPFSEEEDRAIAYGMRGIASKDGALLYFGLYGANDRLGQEAIPFFSPAREDYQEYDMARLIEALGSAEKKTIGLATSLPFDTGAGGLPAAMEGRAKPFAIYQEMRERFDLTFLEQEFREIPKRVQILIIAHPKPLSEATLYAIDQFLMRGGRLLLFLDPWSELSLVSSQGRTLRGSRRQSDLKPLLQSWGILYSPKEVVADRGRAMQVAEGGDPRNPLAQYVLWLALEGESIAKDPITRDLDIIHLASAGRLKVSENYKGAFHPLLTSSKDSAILPPPSALKSAQPRDLLENFVPSGENHILAARFSGPFQSAFAKAPSDMKPNQEALPQAPLPDHIARTEKGEIIIFADADLFDDRFWVVREASPAGDILQPIADNAKIVMNAMDWLTGSETLIALRAREKARRPFLKMRDLQRQAEKRYLAQARALERQVAEIERNIREGARTADSSSAMRAALLRSRRALRETRRELRADREKLRARLLFLNIALAPSLVIAAALLAALWRRRQSRLPPP